jgi:hypothetical protein
MEVIPTTLFVPLEEEPSIDEVVGTDWLAVSDDAPCARGDQDERS